MTFKEALMGLDKTFIVDRLTEKGNCPCDFDLEDRIFCPREALTTDNGYRCDLCWNREMPEIKEET